MKIEAQINTTVILKEQQIDKIVFDYLKKKYKIGNYIFKNGTAYDYFINGHNGDVELLHKRNQTKREKEYLSVINFLENEIEKTY